VKRIDCSTKTHPNVFAIVDDEDYPSISAHKWSAEKRYAGYYAIRCVSENGKRTMIRMHQQIMGATGVHIDHKDGNGLNNRRSNLRLCTRTENQRNQKSACGTSKYKGVSWYAPTGKWVAGIRFAGKRKYLGYFSDERDAAIAYNKAASELFGEFASLNEI